MSDIGFKILQTAPPPPQKMVWNKWVGQIINTKFFYLLRSLENFHKLVMLIIS